MIIVHIWKGDYWGQANVYRLHRDQFKDVDSISYNVKV